MHSMKNIDGKESNTVKGVNIATEFREFKDTLFNKNLSDTKWEEFKAKNIKLENTKSTKCHYHVLMIVFMHIHRWWCSYTFFFS